MQIRMDAPAKINWALKIEGLRGDGYHLLDMLMQTISLADTLTFQPAEKLELSVNGRTVFGGGNNLVLRAARALNEHAGTRCGARIALVKHIPSRAGLGGGSADCAAALVALNELWGLNIGTAALFEIGLSLGADVPFCLNGGLARVRGVGEGIQKLRAGPRLFLVILRPGIGLSTRDVFAKYDSVARELVTPEMEALHDALVSRDFGAMKRCSQNALLVPAMELMPEIGLTISRLYAYGARFAQMSGSGSAVYGVFEDESSAMVARERLGAGAIIAHT